MTAPASARWRIWSAKDRLPHRTWWGNPGSRNPATDENPLVAWACETLLELLEAAQRTAPTLVVVVLNIFR